MDSMKKIIDLLPKPSAEAIIATFSTPASQRSTSLSVPKPAAPVVAETPTGRPQPTVVSHAEVLEWLHGLNGDLQALGQQSMTPAQIAGFARLLVKNGFTDLQLEVADKYILWGKKTDYRTKDIQPNYFYPTREEMLPFGNEFVHITEVDAGLREQERKFKEYRTIWEQERSKLQTRVKDLMKEIERLERAPAPTAEPLPEDVAALTETMRKLLNTDTMELRAKNANLRQTKTLNDRQIQRLNEDSYKNAKTILDLRFRLVELGEKINISPEEAEIFKMMKLQKVTQ